MTEQSESVRKYLYEKYIQFGLMDEKGNHVGTNPNFDPWIYPDTGYIPFCSKCQGDYKKYNDMILKPDTVKFNHKHQCLWHDYFINKVKTINPKIKITYK